MSILKREKNKVYISEDSLGYAVFYGREKDADVYFMTENVIVNDPENPDERKRVRCLWFISECPKDYAPHVINDFSTYNLMEVKQRAHDLALKKAEGIVHLSQITANWPVTTPDAKGPTRSPNHVTLTRIIDNSRSILGREDSNLVEYTKEPGSFYL